MIAARCCRWWRPRVKVLEVLSCNVSKTCFDPIVSVLITETQESRSSSQPDKFPFMGVFLNLRGLVGRRLPNIQATNHTCICTDWIYALCDIYLHATYPFPSTNATFPPYSSTHFPFLAHSPPSTPHNPSHQHLSTSSQGLRNT